jgi:hypothetical protein
LTLLSLLSSATLVYTSRRVASTISALQSQRWYLCKQARDSESLRARSTSSIAYRYRTRILSLSASAITTRRYPRDAQVLSPAGFQLNVAPQPGAAVHSKIIEEWPYSSRSSMSCNSRRVNPGVRDVIQYFIRMHVDPLASHYRSAASNTCSCAIYSHAVCDHRDKECCLVAKILLKPTSL